MVGQVRRAQERVPERLGGPVAVEDAGGEQLLVAQAGRAIQRRAHRDDAVQARQVARALLLLGAEQGEVRRGADEEGQRVLLDPVEDDGGVERTQRHRLGADVEDRVGPAGVQPAAVEPGRHVQRPVLGRQREVHDHVVGGEHLDGRVEGHALGQARRAGGVQPRGLVVDRRARGRLGHRAAPAQQVVEGRLAHDREQRRPVLRAGEGVGGEGRQRGVVHERAGAAVVEHVRRLARREAEVDRRRDRAEALRRQPQQGELGAVVELEDDDVAGTDAGVGEPRREAADVGPELGVRPAPAARGIVQRGARGEPVAVAVDARDVGEVMLEDLAEGRGVVAVDHVAHAAGR